MKSFILALAFVLAGIANHGCELVAAASLYPDHIKEALDRLAEDGKIARGHLEYFQKHGRPPDDVMKKIAEEAVDALGLLFINEEDVKDDMRIGYSVENGTALKESIAKVKAVYKWMGKVKLAEPESRENITADMPIVTMLRVVGSVVRAAQGLEMETSREFEKGTIHKGRPHGGGGLRNLENLRKNSTDRLREMRTKGRRGKKSRKCCADVLYEWSQRGLTRP